MGDLIENISVVLLLVFVAATAVAGLYGLGVIEMNEDFDLDIDFGGDDPYDSIGDTPTPDDSFDTDAVAQGVRKAINIVRSDNGLAELPHNDSAAAAAASHSAEMADIGLRAEPDSPGTMADAVDSCNTFAVNVGVGEYHEIVVDGDDRTKSDDEVAVDVTEVWLDSDEERANILGDDWDMVGVGVVTGDYFNEKAAYVTVLFCSDKSSVSI